MYVRSRDGVEREVGRWPDGDPVEALALYTRRFEGLAVEVALLERRVRREALSPSDARAAVDTVRALVVDAQAVGDLESLIERLDLLQPVLDEQRQQRRAAKVAVQEEARAAKERLVVEAEKLATSDDWRGGVDELGRMMDAWRQLPRIDRGTDDALWRRFSSARMAYSRRRKTHLAEVHQLRDRAREVKRRLADEADQLADSTEWGPTAARFRDLMRQWKEAGSAPHRDEERLWRRFRAAQDTFFGARDAQSAKADATCAVNAESKLALLVEAERLLPASDVRAARARFREIAARWDAAGKVPRERVRELDGRMRAVEQALQAAEQEHARRDNPEARARAEAAVAQLEASLTGLRQRAAAASAAGDDRSLAEANAAIEAREVWLDQARATLSDVS